MLTAQRTRVPEGRPERPCQVYCNSEIRTKRVPPSTLPRLETIGNRCKSLSNLKCTLTTRSHPLFAYRCTSCSLTAVVREYIRSVVQCSHELADSTGRLESEHHWRLFLWIRRFAIYITEMDKNVTPSFLGVLAASWPT